MDNKPKVDRVIPFFWVTDMRRSLRYYVEGLDFVMAHSWVVEGKIRWCMLQHGGASLMLQEYAASAEPLVPTANPILGKGVSLYFMCEDALAIYSDLSARGVQASEPFVGNQMWVMELTDPDGYQIFFTSYTDEPEETRLSQREG